MSDDLANTISPLEEQLVSYLDGELSPDESRQVEELLATDVAARETMQRLDRTWEMLERLDRPEAGEQFARTTLEMVAAEAERDVAEVRSAAPRRRRRRAAWAVAGLLAAGLAGFLAVAWLMPDPNRQLLDDLPVLEELDAYLEVGELEFLRELQRQQVLADESSPVTDVVPATALGEDLEAAREKIENMTPQQREELLERHRQFLAMKPEERARTGQLHRELYEDPQSQELCDTMRRYHAWLNALPAVTRYELRDLPPAERIERVKQLVARSRPAAGEPTPEDLAGLRTWFQEYVGKMRRQFADRVPEDRREQFARLGEAEQRWLTTRLIFERWHGPGQLPSLADEDKAALRESLTPRTRAWLDQRPPGEQARILAFWIREAMWEKRPGRGREPGREPGQGGPPAALGEQLDRFYAELDQQQQDRLMRLPPDEMQEELLALFLARFNRPDGSTHRHGGQFQGGRPGPGMGGRPRDPGERPPSPPHGPFRPSTNGGSAGRGPRSFPSGPPPEPPPDELPSTPESPAP